MKSNRVAINKNDPVAKAFGRCAIGVLFLLNPNFSLIDILPDAIGYLLILSGLRAIAPVSPSIEEARNRFVMLLRVSLIRIAALPLTVLAGYNEQTFILIFTFAFALFETIYLLPAFYYLYDGTTYLSLRFGGEKSRNITPPRIITIVFIIVRAVCNVLPELQYLPTQYNDGLGTVSDYQPIKLSELQHMLVLANIVFTLLFAIIWIVRFRHYLKRLRCDSELCTALSQTIAAVPRDEGGVLLQSLKPAFTLISIAMFATLDFYADGYNLIPDIIPALLLLAASVILNKCGQCEKRLTLLSVIYTAFTAAEAALNYYFSSNYYAYIIVKNKDALHWQTVQTIFTSITSIVFIIIMFILCRSLVRMVDRHAGLFAEPEFRTKNAKTQRERLRARNLIWACFVLVLLAETMSVIYQALLANYAVLWIPAAALTVALGAFTVTALNNLYYQIELRYSK
jgi:hypothetical protein